MRRLNTDNISNAARMPVKQGTLNHLQLAYKEIGKYITSFLTNAFAQNKPYALYGVDVTLSGGTYTISEGVIVFDGELYPVETQSFPSSGGTAVIATTKLKWMEGGNADPVTFTDGSTHRIHEDVYIKFEMGTAGGGGNPNYKFDLAQMVRVCPPTPVCEFDLVWQNSPVPVVRFDKHYVRQYSSRASSSMTTLQFNMANARLGATTRLQVDALDFWFVGPAIPSNVVMSAESDQTIYGLPVNRPTVFNFKYLGSQFFSGIETHFVSYRIHQE